MATPKSKPSSPKPKKVDRSKPHLIEHKRDARGRILPATSKVVPMKAAPKAAADQSSDVLGKLQASVAKAAEASKPKPKAEKPVPCTWYIQPDTMKRVDLAKPIPPGAFGTDKATFSFDGGLTKRVIVDSCADGEGIFRKLAPPPPTPPRPAVGVSPSESAKAASKAAPKPKLAVALATLWGVANDYSEEDLDASAVKRIAAVADKSDKASIELTLELHGTVAEVVAALADLVARVKS